MGGQRGTLDERFTRYVGPILPNGCQEWQGAIDNGYGVLNGTGHRKEWAHRLAWQFACGPLAPGTHVCHHCDNPRCVRVAHLFIGTNADNRHDSVRKGRQARGEGHGLSRLTSAQVQAIRARLAAGDSHAAIAPDFDVVRQTVTDIALGRRWGWLTPDIAVARQMGRYTATVEVVRP